MPNILTLRAGVVIYRLSIRAGGTVAYVIERGLPTALTNLRICGVWLDDCNGATGIARPVLGIAFSLTKTYEVTCGIRLSKSLWQKFM